MKKLLIGLLSVVVLGLLGWGGFVLFRPDSPQLVAEDQVVVMQEALAAMEKYTDGGRPEEAVKSLELLSQKIADLNERRKKLGNNEGVISPEVLAQIESLGGELVNESLEVEMSEEAKAAEVAAAFEKFSSR